MISLWMWLGTRSPLCFSQIGVVAHEGPRSIEAVLPQSGGLPVGDVGVLGNRSSGEFLIRITGRTVKRSWGSNGSVPFRCGGTILGVT